MTGMKSFLRKYRMCFFVIGVHLLAVIVFAVVWGVVGIPSNLLDGWQWLTTQ